MKFCQDTNTGDLSFMDDLRFSQDHPFDCVPAEVETELSSIPNLCFPETDYCSNDFCAPLESGLPNLYTWPQEDLCQSLGTSDTLKPKKSGLSKAIRKPKTEDTALVKKMRNRVSAQRSRDKRKEEVESLKHEIERLRQENCSVKSKLNLANKELDLIRQAVNKDAEYKSKDKSSLGYKLLIAMLLLGYFFMASCTNPLMNFLGASEDSQKVKREEKLVGMTEEEQLTPVQRKRRRLIEAASHIKSGMKSEQLETLKANSKESDMEI